MLNACNEKMRALREKIQRRTKVDAMLRDLYAQRTQQEKRVSDLVTILYEEQEDVEKLSGGFWSVYYAMIGKKEEMLEKERAEALKASMQYDAARAELQKVQEEIDRLEWEKKEFDDYEREYSAVLDEKLNFMRKSSMHAEKIVELEEKIEYLGNQIGEIDEAECAGRRVLNQIDLIAESLDNAEGWGTWDMLGGGMLSSMVKHAHLDEAQERIKSLERLLSRFRTELADVTVQADVRAQMDGFTRFADWFFDGFFVDWMVLSRIKESKGSLETTEKQIQRVMEQLRGMRREMVRAQEKLNVEIRSLAENAQ